MQLGKGVLMVVFFKCVPTFPQEISLKITSLIIDIYLGGGILNWIVMSHLILFNIDFYIILRQP